MSRVIVERPYYPTLLLSPDGSRDRQGPVIPTVTAGIEVVPGRFGPSWRATTTTSRVTVPAAEYLNHAAMTILARFRLRASGTAGYLYAAGAFSTGFIGIFNAPTNLSPIAARTVNDGGGSDTQLPIQGSRLPGLIGEVVSSALRVSPTSRDLNVEGVREASSQGYTNRTWVSGAFGFGQVSQAVGAELESLLIFDEALPDEDIARIFAIPSAWTWDNVAILRPHEVEASLPDYTSGANHMETRVYITDRNNQRRDLIDATEIDVQPDWDIDRAGSKGQVDVTASRGVLEPGMWIAPYQVIIPETGDIIEQQKGHFRLGRPGSMFDDTVGYDGNHRHIQNAFGSDIVDDIAAVKLPETFSTPRLGHVMTDVYVAIKLATAGIIGPNMFTNGGFEQESAGWVGPLFTTGQGSFSWNPSSQYGAPEGRNVFHTQFSSSNPAGGAAVIRTPDIPVRQGAEYMYASGFRFSIANTRLYLEMRFFDAGGASLGTMRSTPDGAPVTYGGTWVREFMVALVPATAFFVQLWVWSIDLQGGRSTACYWDDLRMSTLSTLPLPDGRINLPPSNATATTRIQTAVGDSFGYHAINADRLAAIGHHALFAEQDGRLASIPLRDTNAATPVRRYVRTDIRDYRIIGPVEMPASDGNVPNHFIAVKESFEEGVATIYANAYNDNPNDAFSTVNTGRVVSADPIMVQDAVDQSALQAVANNARDRHSAQEELRIWVLPDATLNAHDVVEIDDPTMPGVSGKWLVQYVRPGMRPDDPLLELGLRRALTGGL